MNVRDMRSFVWWVGLELLFVVGCGSSLPGRTKPGADAALACAGPGEPCAARGCCGALSDACLQQGNDWLCVNPILRPADAGRQFDGGGCIVGLTSNLRGVALTFDDAPCTYSQAEIAAGIEVPYHEEIALALGGLHPVDDDGGPCQQPDVAGLIVSYDIAGAGQRYCICDVSLCLQSFTTSSTVGSYARQIAWDGRNWDGPSNTDNPEGSPFPVGTYTVTVTATGSIDGTPNRASPKNFAVTATRTITITP